MRTLTLVFFCIFMAAFQFSCTPEDLEEELKMEVPEEYYGDSGDEDLPEDERD